MLEPHEAAKGASAFNLGQAIFNDGISALLGFVMGNIIACDYIYKRRIYIVERLHWEKTTGFNRYTYHPPTDTLEEEYPFAEYITLKDKEIVEERIHPKEVVEHS